MKRKTLFSIALGLALVLILAGAAMLPQYQVQAQGTGPQAETGIQADVGTGFSYQGRLVKNGSAVGGACDFQFSLWDDPLSGSQIGSTLNRNGVALDGGNFSVGLDFGANAFQGDARYLQIAVRCPAGSGGFTSLGGRVHLSPTPYAHSLRPGAAIVSQTAGQLGAVLRVEDRYNGAFASSAIHAESNQGVAMHGQSLGNGTGVEGKAGADGKGVYGESHTGHGVSGKATHATGHGVYGTSPSTDPQHAGVTGANTGGGNGAGVYGYSVGGVGVNALATSGTGVMGTGSWQGVRGEASDGSGTTYGVYGKAVSLSGKGVYGEGGYFGVHGVGTDASGTSYGVYGQTDSTGNNSYGGYFIAPNNIGLYARGDDGPFDPDVRLAGAYGVLAADENADSSFYLQSNKDIYLYLDSNDDDAASTFGIMDRGSSSTIPVFEVDQAGNTWASGTKNAVVTTENHGRRKLYAMESPEVWFEDFGAGTLTNGVAEISIDAMFAETVSLDDYHVFLTPMGDCNGLYVAAKSPTAFEVRELNGGQSNVAFDFRLVAKRLGYEDVRMEEAK